MPIVTLSLFAGAGAQLLDNNGKPLSGGLIYTYAAGTTTPAVTYTSLTGDIPNSNPIVLDSAGRINGEIWLTYNLNYKFVIKDSEEVTIGTYDDIAGAISYNSLTTSLLTSDGSSYIGFIQSGTGAVTRTAQSKMRETVSVEDFGITSLTNPTFNTIAFQNALNSLSNGGTLEISTNFQINGEVEIPNGNINIVGKNWPLITQTTAGLRTLYGTDIPNVSVSKIVFNGTNASVPYDNIPLDGAGKGLLHFFKTSTGCSNIRITDCEIYNAFTPISCTNVSDLWILFNDIHNFYKFGILSSKSTNFQIEYNVIKNSEITNAQNAYGVMATGDSLGGTVQEKCSISFNTIDTVVSWDGIMSHDCYGLRIIGNDIRNVRTGIDLTWSVSTSYFKDLIVTNNYIKLTTTDGYSGANAQTAGILVVGTGYPTYMSGIIITNNIIDNANNIAGAGISGNVPAALRIDTVTDAVISDNIIENLGNQIAGYAGISAYRCTSNININNNIIRGDISGDGISIWVPNAYTCDSLSITDNIVNTSSSYVTTMKYASLNVVGSGSGNTATFTNLTCVDNSTNGAIKSYKIGTGVTAVMENGDSVFTPTLTFNSGSTGITYNERYGVYRKEGNKVFFSISIQLSHKGSSIGDATIEGLPFTSAINPVYSPFSVYFENMSFITEQVIGYILGGTANISLAQMSGGTGFAKLNNFNFTDASKIAIQGFITIS